MDTSIGVWAGCFDSTKLKKGGGLDGLWGDSWGDSYQ